MVLEKTGNSGVRKLLVETAQYWYDLAADSTETPLSRIAFMEQALNHTESALSFARNKIGELEAVEYLLSEEYKPLLLRAIYSRLSTTTNHEDKHKKAAKLVEAL